MNTTSNRFENHQSVRVSCTASFKVFLAAKYLARWSSGFLAAANSFLSRLRRAPSGPGDGWDFMGNKLIIP